MTKMRYSRGWNVSLFERGGKSDSRTTKVTARKAKPEANISVANNPVAKTLDAGEISVKTVNSAVEAGKANPFKPAFVNKKKSGVKTVTSLSHQSVEFKPSQKSSIHKPAGDGGGFGLAGFILALLAILAVFAGPIGLVVWLLGLIFSIIGLGGDRSNKGLAIAGLIISLLPIIIFLAVVM